MSKIHKVHIPSNAILETNIRDITNHISSLIGSDKFAISGGYPLWLLQTLYKQYGNKLSKGLNENDTYLERSNINYSDIDIWLENESDYDKIKMIHNSYETPNELTFRYKDADVQIIKTFGKIENIAQDFDFVNSRVFIRPDLEFLYTPNFSINDLCTVLIIDDTEILRYSDTIQRVLKYQNVKQLKVPNEYTEIIYDNIYRKQMINRLNYDKNIEMNQSSFDNYFIWACQIEDFVNIWNKNINKQIDFYGILSKQYIDNPVITCDFSQIEDMLFIFLYTDHLFRSSKKIISYSKNSRSLFENKRTKSIKYMEKYYPEHLI